MDITVQCANEACVAFGKEKPVPLNNMLGYGSFSAGVRCHACGTMMTTTKSGKASEKGRTEMIRRKVSAKPRPKRK
jgi:hypothetical protein